MCARPNSSCTPHPPPFPTSKSKSQQQENLISILLGENPSDVTRGLELTAQPHAPEVPPGLPSSLLERRPDIREAEAQLMAANAQIGVAKAAYFPSISLTGHGGVESVALSNLFTGPAGMWSFVGQAHATALRRWQLARRRATWHKRNSNRRS